MSAYHLHQLYPDPATRPQMCGVCVHDQTNHLGTDTHAWCGITDSQQPANHECTIGSYVEREQSSEEIAHLEEVTRGGAFARLRKQLIAQATEGTRELVEFSPGLYVAPTPGRNVAQPNYPEDAA